MIFTSESGTLELSVKKYKARAVAPQRFAIQAGEAFQKNCTPEPSTRKHAAQARPAGNFRSRVRTLSSENFGNRAAAAPRIDASYFGRKLLAPGSGTPELPATERAARAGTESGSSAWKFPQAALRRAASGTADSELPSRTPCAVSEFKRRSSAQRRFPPAPQDFSPTNETAELHSGHFNFWNRSVTLRK